jgi:membrane protein
LTTVSAETSIPKIRLRAWQAWQIKTRRSLLFLLSFVKKIWVETNNDDLFDLAAVMSFYFVLSLMPFLLVIAAFVGWLPTSNLWHNFAQWVTDYLPPESRTLVFSTVVDLTHGYQSFFSIGLAGTIWAASSGFVSLMESLSLVYDKKETRGYWHKRFIAIVATMIAVLFLIASFGILAFGRWTGVQLWNHLESVILIRVILESFRWLATLLLMCLGLDLINYFLPNVRRRWTWLTSGTLFVALAFVAASIGFNFYIGHFGNYPHLYGALAAFIVLMIWIYMACLILLIGAEIDNSLARLPASQV